MCFEIICITLISSHTFSLKKIEVMRIRHISLENILFTWYRFFLRAWMTRNMSYTYDFEAHKNLSHKQSVLFYWYPCNWFWSISLTGLRLSETVMMAGSSVFTCIHKNSVWNTRLKLLECHSCFWTPVSFVL